MIEPVGLQTWWFMGSPNQLALMLIQEDKLIFNLLLACLKYLNQTSTIPGLRLSLKVILINEHDVQLVLSNFSHDTATEANQSFSQFKVARDKTPQEQKYLRVLIAEIEERKSKGENDLKIKFKNNIPSIVKMSRTD